MMNLVPGDVVSRSDGPPMTVDRIEGDFAHCVWFVECDLFRDKFSVQELVRAQP
jgi:uncharacterized protein YodC (DUF2158 family)